MIPKATVYRQLGNTYQDALWALPKVHAEIEALFDLERRTTDEHRARELVRERLGERHQSMFIEGAVDPECPEFDDFQELVEDVEHAVPSVDIPTPRSSATCLRLSPLVSAIRTASLRNSSVRVSIIVHLLCCSKCYQRSGIKPRQVHWSASSSVSFYGGRRMPPLIQFKVGQQTTNTVSPEAAIMFATPLT